MIKECLMAGGLWMFSMSAGAQLSTNPDKFLGNITTGWKNDMDASWAKSMRRVSRRRLSGYPIAYCMGILISGMLIWAITVPSSNCTIE